MDEPARPRFFTVMGWILIVFGVAFPIRTLFGLYSWWKMVGAYDIFWDQWAISAAILTGALLGGALDSWSGWGLLKRRSWAPLVAAFAGGHTVAGFGWFLFRVREHYARGAGFHGTTQAVVTRALDFLPAFVHAICWMILLGVLFSRDGRRQFPSGRTAFTSHRFWIAAASGVAVSFLYEGISAAILHDFH
jgi:hypothetical protein